MFEILEPELKMQPTIQLRDGSYFNILKPDDYDFKIETIAWALSHINRFTGHTKVPYSVAQHSVMVSQIVPACDALAGLLHDATEAFIGDVSSPLKQLLPEYKTIEGRIEAAILKHFGLESELPRSVKHADTVMLVTERRDLMPPREHSAWEWTSEVIALKEKIKPLTPKDARKQFLDCYKIYTE